MCGILGVYQSQPIDPDQFVKALNTMSHRGPDGWGQMFDKDHRVGLGHRRLAILDLSENGEQPMSNQDQSLWLTS